MSIVSLTKLQTKILDGDQTLVEYFVGEYNIFVFIIAHNLFKVQKIKKDFPLDIWIESLRKNITQYQFPFNLPTNYHKTITQHSSALYSKLIAPIEFTLKKRVTIIPGGVLAEIPFECLIKEMGSQPENYKEHHYLFQDYAISYSYSGTLLSEMVSNRRAQSNHRTIAFAPNFQSFGQSNNLRDLSLLPLQYNIPEVEGLNSIMGAKTMIGDEATESSFTEQAPNFSIIHFATHAKADPIDGNYSFLAFSEVHDTLENELLFVKDIYNLPLRSEMITLSACQTGIGENRKGEGVISLARAFSFAGTSNINTSLWNVSDAKTAKLMTLFYSNIADGQTKDLAMQHAKQQFIDSYDKNMQVHPFFWTPMISIGDMVALDIPWRPSPYLWVFSILFAFSLVIWGYKRSLTFN